MNITTRRTLATCGGLVIALAAVPWAFFGGGIASELFNHRHDVASVIGSDAVYKKFADVYIFLGIFGLCLAAGLCFTLIFWEPRAPQGRVAVVYAVLLLLVLPLTVLNYWSGDTFVSRERQALIDAVLVFLGLTTATYLFQWQVRSVTARVLQAMVLFFVVFQAVIVPAVFSVLWFLNWQGAITAAHSRNFTPGWISLVATTGSLAVSALRYFHSPTKSVDDRDSPIIQLR